MTEVTQYSFSHKEAATALVKQAGLHDGTWQIALNFGFTAANINGPDANGKAALFPAAITPVMGFVFQKTDELNDLSVDAAEVNPAPKRSGRQAKVPD